MKVRSVVIVAVVLAISAAVLPGRDARATSPTDVVTNGSFNSYLDGWDIANPYVWFDSTDRFGDPDSGSAYFNVTETDPYNDGISQCVRFAPGIPLSLTAASLLPEEESQAPDAYAYVRVEFFDDEACNGSSKGEHWASNESTSSWEPLEILADSPPGTASAEVFVMIAKSQPGDLPAYGYVDEITLIADADTDNDGCLDGEELLGDAMLGGDRNPTDGWDFFDVPAPALVGANTTGTKNQQIALSDVLSIITFAGTSEGGPANANGADYDSDLNGNGVADGQEYDRTPSVDPTKPWRSGPPSGLVTLADALAALQQVGHSCAS